MKPFRSLLKRFGLSILIGLLFLFGLAVVISQQPFSLLSKLAVLLSPYRNLLPYIIAQARHETANFTSNIYRTQHNLFGMKVASIRKQLGSPGPVAPDGGRYQSYSSNLQSVRDFLLYLEAVKFPTMVRDSSEYVAQLLDRRYFGTSGQDIYLNGINRFLS